MFSTLAVTTPAESQALLTAEECRAAAGVTGSEQDAALALIEARVAASIATECNVAIGAGAPPTLLRETLTETFQLVTAAAILLSRRHEIEVVSVTVDGAPLADADFLVDPESGKLIRLIGSEAAAWRARRLVVVYEAGFTSAPPDLKMAAADFLRLAWREKDRDPALKREVVDIPGVQRREREYWVGSIPGQANEGPVPDVVAGQLQRYRNGPFA